MKTLKTQNERDARIRQLHDKAAKHWPELEGIIDELKTLGPHSLDGNNALENVRLWLSQLSRR